VPDEAADGAFVEALLAPVSGAVLRVETAEAADAFIPETSCLVLHARPTGLPAEAELHHPASAVPQDRLLRETGPAAANSSRRYTQFRLPIMKLDARHGLASARAVDSGREFAPA